MLRFIRLLRYRDEVLDHLGALLLMYPRGRQFQDDFVAIRQALRSHYEAGVTPTSSALQLAAGIIADLAGQLDPEARRAVARQVAALGDEELQTMVQRRIAGAPDLEEDAKTFMARLIGVALFMARRMRGTGALGGADHDYFRAEIERALAWREHGTGRIGGDCRL